MTIEIRNALKNQFHRGLAMLTECVKACPSDLWIAPNPPAPVTANPNIPRWGGVSREFWRIAFHGAYFTHLYLSQSEFTFVPPPETIAVRTKDAYQKFWFPPYELEPYDLPENAEACCQDDLLEYIRFVDIVIEKSFSEPDLEHKDIGSEHGTLGSFELPPLNLAAAETGFSWYGNDTKISHLLLNLRHLQGHVGQLSELLMLRGIDIRWQ